MEKKKNPWRGLLYEEKDEEQNVLLTFTLERSGRNEGVGNKILLAVLKGEGNSLGSSIERECTYNSCIKVCGMKQGIAPWCEVGSVTSPEGGRNFE